MDQTIVRKLTTILAADAEGYSRLMAADERTTLEALRASRGVFRRLIERHGGRIVNTAGDGLLADFPSVVEAVQCAVEVQRELAAAAASDDPDRVMRFRIGIHLGDVMVDGGDLFGEGVNLAARLQSLAAPGGILISEPVYQQVRTKVAIGFDDLGAHRPKNFPEAVRVWGVILDDRSLPGCGRLPGGDRKWRQAADGAPRAEPPWRPAAAPAEGARRRVIRRAQLYGVTLLWLAVVDLSTGSGLWVQWPALGLSMALGLEAAPLLTRGWIDGLSMRILVVSAGLLAINALTWRGYPWALWPIGGLLFLVLLRALARGRSTSTPGP